MLKSAAAASGSSRTRKDCSVALHGLKHVSFCRRVCAVRWTLQYYKASNRVLCESNSPVCENAGSCLDVSVVEPTTKHILSQQEKYRKAFHVSQKLASEALMREFNEKLKSLEKTDFEYLGAWRPYQYGRIF